MNPILLVCAVGFLSSMAFTARTVATAPRSANAGRGPTRRETRTAIAGYLIAALAFAAAGAWNVAIS